MGRGGHSSRSGRLLVDFTITVAISCAAGASAIIAYLPGLAGDRVLLALALAALVAGGICLGHRGRIGFAVATLMFLLLTAVMIVAGAFDGPEVGSRSPQGEPLIAKASLISVLLAMPLGMALATGIEAPSDAPSSASSIGASVAASASGRSGWPSPSSAA